jgi:hypothetical protein
MMTKEGRKGVFKVGPAGWPAELAAEGKAGSILEHVFEGRL